MLNIEWRTTMRLNNGVLIKSMNMVIGYCLLEIVNPLDIKSMLVALCIGVMSFTRQEL